MRIILMCVGLSTLAACGGESAERPNVLLISLDTFRADALGTYGSRKGGTPVLDSLAQKGTVFESAYTVTPLTIPAHASLMTGVYPPRHGVQDNGDFVLQSAAVTLAERIQAAGYRTGASVGAEVTSRHWGFNQGFGDYYDDMHDKGVHEEDRWKVERPAPAVLQDIQSWIGKNSDTPWFAWVHLFDAHHPYVPSPPFDQKYADDPYYGEVASLDAALGGLLETLRRSGELSNTWVVVLADHGEALGNHGEPTHGALLYDSTMRIPLFVVPPSLPVVRRVSQPVSLIDIAPTLVDVTGAKPMENLDGISLLPLMKGQGQDTRSIYLESLYANRHYGWAPQRGVRTDAFKLIDSTTPEVYEAGDAAEETNLASKRPQILEALRNTMSELRGKMSPLEVSAEVGQNNLLLSQLEALGYVTSTSSPSQEVEGLPDPSSKMDTLRRVEAYRRAYRDGALDVDGLKAFVLEEPGILEMHLLLAQSLFKKGEIEQAMEALKGTGKLGTSTQVDVLYAHFRMGRGDLEGAVSDLKGVLTREPYHAKAWVLFLNGLILSGQSKQLATEAVRAEEMLPNDPIVACLAGVALWNAGEFKKAESRIVSGLERYPKQPHGRYVLGHMALRQGNTKTAEEHLNSEIALFAPAIPARKTLVALLASQKRYKEQLKQLKIIGEHEKPNHLTSHSIAQVLFNLKQYNEALEEVYRCSQLAPEYARCVLLEANVLSQLGKKLAAKKAFERAQRMVKKGR